MFVGCRLTKSTGKYEGLTPQEAVTTAQQFWDCFVQRRFNVPPVHGPDHNFEHNWYLKIFVMDVSAAAV